MRTEQEMMDLILSTANADDRVRAVILNGSRANPDAAGDIFQDFDVIYVVMDVASFKKDPIWIKRFGEIMIMQLPDDMKDPPPVDGFSYAYLMQFADGNRIDLTLYPVDRLNEMEEDSLCLLLLDKDGIIEPFQPADDRDYLPRPPTAKAFSGCCNEFWWVSTYVAKGLWREEIIGAKIMLDQIVREQLMKILNWHIGVKTQFKQNPGKFGKYFRDYLEPALWDELEKTYSDAGYESTWDALFTMCDIFRLTAHEVAEHFGFDYPQADDERVTAHLQHVRTLSKDSKEMY